MDERTVIHLQIDQKTVEAAPGATILEAALSAGIDIPHLCHEPALGLPPTGACRLCLVEVEGARGPVAACVHPASDGMVVRTDTPRLREYRRGIIELLLSDHPSDCLTCEKAGSCQLQRYAYELGVRESGLAPASRKPQPEQDGPAIVYDRSKCLLCGRCVEVCQHVQVAGAIDLLGRGIETRVGPPPGMTRREAGCVDCGNCLDVCPTGALAFAGAVGRGREWEAERIISVCPYCGCGCPIELRVRNGQVLEVRGLPHGDGTRGLLCVKGRFGFDFLQREDRLTVPLVRREGRLVPASWEEALDLVAGRLAEIKERHGPDAIAGLASAKCTNEENYLMQKFMRAVVGTNNIDHCARLCHASTVAGLARAFGSGAMTNSIADLAEADVIFVIGSNTTECHPAIGALIKRTAQSGRTRLIVADPRAIELTQWAEVHLRQRHGTDVALLNALANVILEEGLADEAFIADRTEGFEEWREAVRPYTPELAERICGVPAEEIVRAARLYGSAEAAAIVYSMGITQHTHGTDNVLALANLAMLTGNIGRPGTGVNPLRGQNNVQGACDMGCLPDLYPGYQRVTDEQPRARFAQAWGMPLPASPGLTVVEMIEAAAAGKLKALYIMGENPMLSDPDITHVEAGLRQLELLVVQDIFLTETAELAHVVLPAAAFAEKDGCFTNTERRVQRVRKAVAPPGQARADWEIICALATRLGYQMAYSGPAAIQEEIASLTPIYGGITYDRLEQGSLQWPCLDREHPGTPILHQRTFARGRGRFHPVEFLPARELPDAEYPFVLSTGRILEHYHTGSMTRRSQVLDTLVPGASLEIHPQDAARLGVADGARVKVSSRRGRIELPARVTDRVLPGCVFLAFHYREAPANRLTIAALDPVAKIPEFKVCAVKIEPA